MKKQEFFIIKKYKCFIKMAEPNKFLISVYAAVLFLIISLPDVYKLTNQYIGPLIGRPLYGINGPTTTGLLIHTAVFLLITRLSMW